MKHLDYFRPTECLRTDIDRLEIPDEKSSNEYRFLLSETNMIRYLQLDMRMMEKIPSTSSGDDETKLLQFFHHCVTY